MKKLTLLFISTILFFNVYGQKILITKLTSTNNSIFIIYSDPDFNTSTTYTAEASFDTGFTQIRATKSCKGCAVLNISEELQCNTQYYVRIKSSSGKISPLLPIKTKNYPEPPNKAPIISKVTASGFSYSITDSGACYDGWVPYVSTDPDFKTYVSPYDGSTKQNLVTNPITGLTECGPYYIKVAAYQTTIKGDYLTAPSPVAVVYMPVGTPKAIAPSMVTTNSFQAQWSKARCAQYYLLYVSTRPDFATHVSGYNGRSVYGTSIKMKNLAGCKYYYRVKAINGSNISSYSNTINVNLVPTSPTSLSPSSIGTSSFKANWKPVTCADNYKLYVSTSPDFSTHVSGYNGKIVSSTSYTLLRLTGCTYYYRVRANNGGRLSGYSASQAVSLTPSKPTVYAPENVTNWNYYNGYDFDITWSEVPCVDEYFLYLSTESDFSTYELGYDGTKSTTDNRVSVTNSKNCRYFYKVVAKYNGKSSAVSNTYSYYSDPGYPGSMVVESYSENSVTIKFWSSHCALDGQKLYLAEDAKFESIINNYNGISWTGGNQVTFNNIPTNLCSFYIGISNVNGTKESPKSVKHLSLPAPAPSNVTFTDVDVNGFTVNWDPVQCVSKYIIKYNGDLYNVKNTVTSLRFSDNDQSTCYKKILVISERAEIGNDQYLNSSNYYYSATSTTVDLGIQIYGENKFSFTPGMVRIGFENPNNILGCIDGVTYYVVTSEGPLAGWYGRHFDNADPVIIDNQPDGTAFKWYAEYTNGDYSGTSQYVYSSTLPSPPVARSADYITSSSFRVRYNYKSSNSRRYTIEVCTDANCTNVIQRFYGDGTDYATGLSSGTTYYYRVNYYVWGTTTMGTTNWSNVISVTTSGTAGSRSENVSSKVNEEENTGIELSLKDVQVMPNPVSSMLEVLSFASEKEPITYNILDASGCEMISGKLTSTSQKIEVNQLNPGFYLLVLTTSDQKIQTKIIKQ